LQKISKIKEIENLNERKEKEKNLWNKKKEFKALLILILTTTHGF